LPSSSERRGAAGGPHVPREDGGWVELANEFAEVLVRKVHTRNGVRLEITAPKLGHGILLCPLELEALTWQSSEMFSRMLATPFGPEHDDGAAG
jgi:hypothetical protein